MTKRTGLLVLSVVAVWACGSDAANHVADAMVDGAAIIRDAAGSDAAAQMTFEVDCVETAPHNNTSTSSGGTGSTDITVFRADVSIPGLDPTRVTRAFAVLCNHEVFSPRYTCPVGSPPSLTYTCSGTYPYDQQDELDCQTIDVQIEPGHARAVCGFRYHTVVTGTTPSDTSIGATRHHARVVIEM